MNAIKMKHATFLLLTLITTLSTQVHSATKEKTAQECKIYTDRINYQADVVDRRYGDLLLDRHGLYPTYNTVKHPKGYGTYQGHVQKYNAEQKTLNQYVTEAVLNGCQKHVSAYARKWTSEKSPTRPDPSKATSLGYK